MKFSEQQIEEFERIDKEIKRRVLSSANPDDIKRRERQKVFVDSVKHRLACTDVAYHGNMLHKEEPTLLESAV
jgi:hypothetical protein